MVEDVGGLDHFNHERRLTGVEGVVGADACEDAVGEADGGALGGDEGAGVGEEDDEGGLADEGALAGHVGAGDEGERGGVGGAQREVVGDEV